MSEKNDAFNPFDPTGMLKSMRDSGMDAWSKMMIQMVNTEGYAQSTAAMLDAWLTSSAPLRKVIESTMTQVLINFNMPTRPDVIALAERLTNLEMRLDDMDAKLDKGRRGGRSAASQPGPAENSK